MAKKSKKFLQEAVPESHEGMFTNWCKMHGFGSVTAECIAAARSMAKKQGDTTLMRRANFAATANRKGGFRKK